MTRTQVGDVLQESNGDELHVYVHQYADEEINEIEVDGVAIMLSYDPSTHVGRAQVKALIARLNEALTLHEQGCVKLYGGLKVGDWCVSIREPVGNEPRCPSELPHPEHGSVQCSRTTHNDPHHVTVDADYNVIAVAHLVDQPLPA
jgi:hypothetical protein